MMTNAGYARNPVICYLLFVKIKTCIYPNWDSPRNNTGSGSLQASRAREDFFGTPVECPAG
ncbi:hypothetical protein Dthio_PD3696 [Desulfonatronospira thiodismutans ASO3-1]|uniref:Uncharacterized protein n=1 Tax=Desulfonatronospira thiodismutans ASO3-1 TaxID=555779 RepID=D6SK36_9BACT|nr:hypothetical protein Dthio_PD3696 [Desulfonatronospira thiodismutans ASO3-1]